MCAIVIPIIQNKTRGKLELEESCYTETEFVTIGKAVQFLNTISHTKMIYFNIKQWDK
jgi:hypothetical protein